MFFLLSDVESINLWNSTSLCFAYNVTFLCQNASSSQHKDSWCLKFHDPSLVSPSSSPCPELCWGSESWGWRVLSGSGRWEIPSMRSSTPSRISLAHSWKEQTYPHAAQQKPSCGKSHHWTTHLPRELDLQGRSVHATGMTETSTLFLSKTGDLPLSSTLSSVTSDSLAKSPAHLQSHLIDKASLSNRGFT